MAFISLMAAISELPSLSYTDYLFPTLYVCTQSLHDSQVKIILIYLILELGAPPLFILCVKQTILSPHTQRPPSF